MKAQTLTVFTAATALTSVMAIANVANAANFTCSTVDGAGNGATRTCSTEFAPETTDIINESLFLPQFQSSFGTLNSAILEFTGLIEGDAGFESKDARPTTIKVDLSGLLSLEESNGTNLFELNPSKSYQYNVTAYDGKIDFAGTSGRTLEGVTAQQTAQKTYTGSELSPFIGTGSLNYAFSGVATSNVKGTGNIISYVNTRAGAGLKISYNYTKKIPEPATTLGLGVVAAFGLLSQRKKVWKKA